MVMNSLKLPQSCAIINLIAPIRSIGTRFPQIKNANTWDTMALTIFLQEVLLARIITDHYSLQIILGLVKVLIVLAIILCSRGTPLVIAGIILMAYLLQKIISLKTLHAPAPLNVNKHLRL